ncbi:CHASE2 and HATPase_c domain-containing protein [Pusillimonas sp. MFBS29]|uniref:CHASE2 and HATPase_c domain-containing protein n=1 Tax=Pusillimonas sp. MFBS29 TaxID=2886690 RepID=UPI001D101671|nr:CHASE2 and HATPase_c domain-containing protein [Pusillimonas sp. MFBS29]MCC2596038.1 CHASE2 and HATPase_c domain-containing protein [Pusillimonas sp. MFBS29]
MDIGFWGNLEKRVRTEWLLVTIGMAVLVLGLAFFSNPLGLTRLDHAFYDKMLGATAHAIDNDDIVIIAIDDNSINQMGYWPWRRAVHGALLDKLQQARVVGLDFLLSDVNPAYPDDDAILAQAISRHGRVVLPQVIQAHGEVVRPLAPLGQAAAAQGYINIFPDKDGVIRSLRLFDNAEPVPHQHFISAMLTVAGARDSLLPIKNHTGPLLISYAGNPGHFTLYPYVQVLNGNIPPETFKGKYVLVGSWGSGLGDAFPTPLSRDGEAMSGVEILANGLQNAIGDHWIRTPAPWLSAVLACLPVLLVCMVLRRLSPRQSFLATLVTLTLVFAGSWLLLRQAQVWVPLTASIIGVALAYPVWSWRSQEAALQHIDHELQALQTERHGLDGAYTDHESTERDGSLSSRVTQLHGAISQLRRAHEKREETLRFLSHDMRAPQNSILALTQLQKATGTALSEPELLRRVDAYANQTLELVDGFVQLARAEGMVLSPQRMDLVELLAQCCDDLWAQARQQHLLIQFEEPEEPAWIQGNPSLLRRVCRNLLDNAIKYSPADTLIRCSLSPGPGVWVLTIQDQGRGMNAAQQRTLFTPFTRFHDDQPDNPAGAGLGLAFVQTVVRRHGGTLDVQSQEGLGSTFRISLPASA